MILNLKEGIQAYQRGQVRFEEVRYFARTQYSYLLNKYELDQSLQHQANLTNLLNTITKSQPKN